MERIIILSILIAQTFAAPNGCTESCRTYHSESYRNQHTSTGYTDNGHLGQLNVEAQKLLNSDYARPGNWVEHNQYKTDGGHGQVHEERGQIVEGPKRVRYYKKNYTSSYSSGYTNGGAATTSEQLNGYTRHHATHTPDRGHYDNSQITQSHYEQSGGSEVVHQDRSYNRQHNTHVHSGTSGSQNQRLEDFGEYTQNSHTSQHGVSGYDSRGSAGHVHGSDTGNGGNWSTIDTYRTDGGRGRVYEEKGQYVSGPQKVRYYRKNYTSSYSTSGDNVNGAAGTHDLERAMQSMMRELHKDMQESTDSRHVSTSNVMHSGTADLTQGTTTSGHRGGDLQVSESVSYGQQHDHGYAPTGNTAHRHSQNLYVQGQPSDYTTENHSSYERTRHTYVTRPEPVPHSPNPSAGLIRVPLGGRHDYQRNIHDSRLSHQQFIDEQRAEHLNSHQSRVTHHDATSENSGQNVYAQNTARYPSSSGHVRQYEEHWSSSGSTGNIPVQGYSSTHGDQHFGQSQYGTTSHVDKHSSSYHTGQAHNTYVGQPSNYNQDYMTSSGKLTNGMIDLSHGQHTVDCTHEATGHSHRMYKRSAKYRESDDMHPKEADDLNQAGEGFDDFTQQTTGNTGFGQATQKPERMIKIELGPHVPVVPGYGTLGTGANDDEEIKDLWNEVHALVGELEKLANDELVVKNVTFGHQSHSHHTENYQRVTHQHENFRQYGQHKYGNMRSSNHISHWPYIPGTVHQQPGDLTQQTFQDIESGRRTQDPYRSRIPGMGYHQYPEDFTQENEDLTQQTGGFGDFTQQTSGDFQFDRHTQGPYKPRRPATGNLQHSGDLTQENEDLTQQTGGYHDFTQQTSGGLEFGQQTQDPYRSRRPGTGNFPHSGDMTQQNEDLTQQTGGFDDLTQQTSGGLEFGQQTQNPYKPGKPGNGNSPGSGNITQQSSGGLEFGQQTQDPYRPRRPENGSSPHSGDLTQQSERDNFTQQTSADLQFGQQTQGPYRPRRPGTGGSPHSGDLTQASEDFTQQTGGFDDFTQQTSGGLEFGQQTQDPYKPRKPGTGNSPHSNEMTQQNEDLTQQTGGFDDFTQQTSGDLVFGQQTQDPFKPRKPGTGNSSHSGDMTQQTSGGLEFGQQTQDPYKPRKPGTGNSPHSSDMTQQNEDLTQQTGGFDDFTQQTSGGLELGQQTQDPYKPRKPGTGNSPHSSDMTQQNEDLTQQTGGLDDFTQQTSGGLEFGQQTQDPYRPRRPGTGNSSHLGDTTQQTSGGLEFGQQTQGPYNPRRPGTGNSPQSSDMTQQNEDLTQQTGGFGDFTQQTSGGLEFGQQTQGPYNPRRPGTGNSPQSSDMTQQNEDLTQQTGGFGDFTQQTSGGLEFGQQTQDPYRPRRPGTGNSPHSGDMTQQNEDLTQQSGGLDDFTQQTSGGLEFGQQTQDPYRPRRPGTGNSPHSGDMTQQNEDLTQQSGGFDDFTQQTSGGLEFGQQTQDLRKPRKPQTENSPHSGDLIQQNERDDLTQQTSDLQFGQQTQGPYRPRKPGTGNSPHSGDMTQQNEDLTQQTGGFDDLTQQTSGGLEFGQQTQEPRNPSRPGTGNSPHSGNLTQQSELDDLTQQTSGDLQFGQQTEDPYRPRKPGTGNFPHTGDMTQQSEDLTQQTGGFNDFTQQTSGGLEFGQQTQDLRKPGRPGTENSQHSGDLTQQSDHDDFTQQTSGDFQFGQQTQGPYSSRRPGTGNFPHSGDLTQGSEDFTQQTGGFGDFTQQTSGNLEFGQLPQNPYRRRIPASGTLQQSGDVTQQNEDLTQQTGGFGDFTQQTSGNLEFGQHPQDTYRPRRPGTGNFPHSSDMTQQNQDLTQQSGGFGDFTQQTSGGLEFGQHSQNPYRPGTGNSPYLGDMTQQNEDLTQQTGGFGDFTQQTSGNLEFGQQSQNPYNPRRPSNPWQSGHFPQDREDLTQQTGDFHQQTSGDFEFGQQSQNPTDINNMPVQTPRRPAPKPRPRYQQHQYPNNSGRPSDKINEPVEINVEVDDDDVRTGQLGRGDQSLTNVEHKNKTTISSQKPVNPGLEWHYNHNGGELTDENKPTEQKPAIPGLEWHYNHNASELTNNDKPTVHRPAKPGLQWHYDYNMDDLTDQNGPIQQSPHSTVNDNLVTQQTPAEIPREQLGVKTSRRRNRPRSQPTYGSGMYTQYPQDSRYQTNWGLNQHSATTGFGSSQKQSNNVDYGQVTEETYQQRRFAPVQSPTEGKVEPRILEAYGGGPYDSNHNDDAFNRVTPNPSVTIPPNLDGFEPWDIREKPKYSPSTPDPPTVQPLDTTAVTEGESTTPTEKPPNFWDRVGSRITTSFDKAKEKVRNIFG